MPLVLKSLKNPLNNISSTQKLIRSILSIIVVLVLFLISIDLLVTSLGRVGKETVESVLEVTANPFVSLFIGLLITALIQSSSTTTSMIVAMVASGSLDMHRAIPIIMGANIGTTLTNNIVSLTFITKKKKFRRAFSTATLHDHFNILVTIVLFPLQYNYNFLGMISEKISYFLTYDYPIEDDVFYSTVSFSNLMISDYVLDLLVYPILGLVIAGILLFGSIKLLTRVIYRTFIGSTRLKIQNLIFKNPFKSFGWGTILTATIQSSSITSSIVVPLVATGKIKFRHVYPFIVGANIGTTITALLAALFKTPEAVSIAVAHFMFNLIGGVIFLLIPFINRVPVALANLLGDMCLKYRIISVIYIIITFFLLPFAFIYMTK